MSLWNTLVRLIVRDTRRSSSILISRDHIKDPVYSPDPLKAGQHYFRIVLAEMFLQRDRMWLASWYPVVYSAVKLRFGNQVVDIPYIAGSQTLQGAANFDGAFLLNHPLTNLMPFNGGDIEIHAELLAMRGKNYLNNFISILENFSKLLTVPQLSAALTVAAPLAQGVEKLFGIGEMMPRLRFHQLFSTTSGNLQAGYIIVILAEEDQIHTDQLWAVNDQLHYGKSLDESKPLSGYSYMLLKIESTDERDDWQWLTSIREPFDRAKSALANGKSHEAVVFLHQAIATARNSPDLTTAHQTAVALRLKEYFDELRNQGLDAIQPEPMSLQEVMQGAISPELALKRGKPVLEEIFD